MLADYVGFANYQVVMKQLPILKFGVLILGLAGVESVHGGELSGDGADAGSVLSDPALGLSGSNWLSGSNPSFGGVLFPHLHMLGVFGGTTAESAEGLAQGHHDPQDDVTLQGIELGASLRFSDLLHGFAVYSWSSDAERKIDGGFEEYFLKLPSLPGGLELRGGRFFNRFGFQNSVHNHGWDFVNQNLLNGRLLQEGELATDGGELTWNLPVSIPAAIGFSYGSAVVEDEEHDHDHGGEESEFEGDGARFVDDLFGVHGIVQMDYNDFHQHRFVASAAWGDNEYGRTTSIYGAGYEYQWRENGYEPGGRYFRWRNEVVYRRIGAISGELHELAAVAEPSRRAVLDEFGLYSMVSYGFNEVAEAGLRVGWVSGIEEAGQDERYRISPNLTFNLNSARTAFVRLQYDYDQSEEFGAEHSAWLQVGFNWGGPEVR